MWCHSIGFLNYLALQSLMLCISNQVWRLSVDVFSFKNNLEFDKPVWLKWHVEGAKFLLFLVLKVFKIVMFFNRTYQMVLTFGGFFFSFLFFFFGLMHKHDRVYWLKPFSWFEKGMLGFIQCATRLKWTMLELFTWETY